MIPSSERARLLRTALALLAGNALYSLTVVLFLVPSASPWPPTGWPACRCRQCCWPSTW